MFIWPGLDPPSSADRPLCQTAEPETADEMHAVEAVHMPPCHTAVSADSTQASGSTHGTSDNVVSAENSNAFKDEKDTVSMVELLGT